MSEGKTSKYFKYAIGEILLVVIGILIALQINNWNSNRIKAKEAEETYRNIRRQVMEDRAELTKVFDYNEKNSAR